MKSVLITGGAGFIGSHLVDRLIAENNWRVTVLDDFNNYYSPVQKYHNIVKHINHPSFSLFGGDILSESVLEGILANRQFDCIVHLAARVGIRSSILEPKLYAETNIKGTLNLLEAARKHQVKHFVFGSSSSVFGNNRRVPFVEDNLLNEPISPYAATKSAGESLCHAYSHLYGLRAICLRFFTAYGPRQRPDLVMYKFANLIKSRQPVTLYGDGTTRRDYTYVSDIVEGICAAMEYEQSSFEIFNLGAANPVKLYDLVKLLEQSLNEKAIIERLPLRSSDVTQTFADISKAQKLLGYHPKISIESGIERFVKWFETHTSHQEYTPPNEYRNFSTPAAELQF